MSKLVNTQLSIDIISRAKELIETRGWWRGIDGEVRQVIDVNGKPTGYLESPKRVSGYTLMGALTTAGQELGKKHNQDTVYKADCISTVFVEAAIAKHCNDISYTLHAFNRDTSTNQKKILSVLNTTLSAMKEQLK
jgi:hypothetical protein